MSTLQFACPSCRKSLQDGKGLLQCTECKKSYPLRDGTPIFIEQKAEQTVQAHARKPSLLRKVARVLRPPHHSLYFGTLRSSTGEGEELRRFLRAHKDLLVLNIGSLSKDLSALHPKIFNLDISWYPNIDVVADAHSLPFPDGSIDVILLKNVLEHVREPGKVLSEIERVLRPGGYFYAKIPFLQPFHAVPDDYQRYSVSGIDQALRNFEKLDFGIAVGPGSMMAWMLREYLAIITSFGKAKLYAAGLFFWGWLTFWVRYTDFFFWGNRYANRLTSAFYGLYRKAGGPSENAGKEG